LGLGIFRTRAGERGCSPERFHEACGPKRLGRKMIEIKREERKGVRNQQINKSETPTRRELSWGEAIWARTDGQTD
jgi:hypothetical protein